MSTVRARGDAPLRGRWSTAASLAGVVFVVLLFVGVGLAGDPGKTDGQRIATHFADGRTRILLATWIQGLGLFAFLVWAWVLKDRVDVAVGRNSSLGTAVLVAGAATAVAEFPVLALDGSLAYMSTTAVDPAIARALYNTSTVFSYVDYFPMAAFFLAAGFAALRTGFLPWAVGWTAIGIALVGLVVALPSLGLDAAMAGLSFLWIVVASIILALGHRSRQSSEDAPARIDRTTPGGRRRAG